MTTAVSIASFQEQIRATQDLIKIQTGVLDVLNKQFQLGGIAKSDVLTQQTTLNKPKKPLYRHYKTVYRKPNMPCPLWSVNFQMAPCLKFN